MKKFAPYLVSADQKLDLSKIDADEKPYSCGDKAQDKARINELAEAINIQQDLLYAEHGRSLLVVLQGMDTSGKDGTIRSVFGRTDPLGIRATSFKAPSTLERDHDFLWRIHQHAPAAGEIALFNRSHYEDVLITRVKTWIDDAEAERRLAHIRNFEALLHDRGTRIIKCFLHISKNEQKERLEARLADPAKNWKFDPADLIERQSWDAYQAAYAAALPATSREHAPWYVIPANSKTHRNLMIAELVLATLQDMQLKTPKAHADLKGVVVT